MGEATLRESAVAADANPDAVARAMLQGVREMGVREALGWSEDTEAWRTRALWFRARALAARKERGDEGLGDEGLGDDASVVPDLSDDALLASADEWLARCSPASPARARSASAWTGTARCGTCSPGTSSRWWTRRAPRSSKCPRGAR